MKHVLFWLGVVQLLLCFVVCEREHRGYMDDLLEEPYRLIRRWMATSLDAVGVKNDPNNDRRQVRLSDIEFPCPINGSRSPTRPTSVHKLRPGDIDVVGAIGDSVTTGFGLFAYNLVHVIEEFRGASFSIGGDGTWREYLTIPNIIRIFNPNLIGYSLGSALSIQKGSQFNVAEGGAISDNTPYMSQILVRRMLHDPRVDNERDWKLITVFIGHNDFCFELCYMHNPAEALEFHRKDLVQVLRTLRDNLKRTMVFVIPPLNIFTLKGLRDIPNQCSITHSVECPCVFGLVHQSKAKLYESVANKWQQLEAEVVSAPEFARSDFAVVFQPFTIGAKLEVDDKGTQDITLFSADCFHLSQKGHAEFTHNYWNNMFEPVGKKNANLEHKIVKGGMLCPTEDNPYIYTNENSKH